MLLLKIMFHLSNAEDLNIVIPMYNILKYSKNYSMISGRL